MQRLLGDEFLPFLETYQQPPNYGLRVNTLKLSVEDFRAICHYPLSPIPWCPSGFLIHKETQASPGKHPQHAAGLYYLQEPSAMAAAELLGPQPGEHVLDLAAAPGGKATHLASLMHGQGILVANEMHPIRAWELAENLERWGAQNTAILNETPERLAEVLEGWFDRVLLDAPCSGEGMFRKSESARRDWAPQVVTSCAARQSAILTTAARFVRPGGRLAYSTCTFSPEENEAVIARFLKEQPDFHLAEAMTIPGGSPGREDWIPAELQKALGRERLGSLQQAVRLWPHRLAGEGHFIAVLLRSGPTQPARHPPRRPATVSKEAARLFRAFCEEYLSKEFEAEQLVQIGSYLYYLPAGMPDLGTLKSLRPGLWLGTVKKGRFEPSHALAMALTKDQAHEWVELDVNQTAAYLRGEPLQQSGTEGWVLPCIDGHPLGWGKCVKGVMKNFYPKGLRQSYLFFL
jgi:NOL1/NOP2/sun family putative RNA methylase